MELFKNLGLNEDLLKGIEELGFSTPTPVQELVIPKALTTSGDIVALAQTGTGKTAAFGLPLLQLIDLTQRHVQGLILCRCGDAAIYREMRQECANLCRSHLLRVPLVVKQDEPLDPRNVGLLRAISQMFDPAGIGHLVKKPGFPKSLRWR